VQGLLSPNEGHVEANREPAPHGNRRFRSFDGCQGASSADASIPQLAYAGHMRPRVEPLELSGKEGSTRIYCATCGHSEYVHADNSDRRCLYTVCDCNRFIAGAVPDISGQVLPA
jgi:hypothetical protein